MKLQGRAIGAGLLAFLLLYLVFLGLAYQPVGDLGTDEAGRAGSSAAVIRRWFDDLPIFSAGAVEALARIPAIGAFVYTLVWLVSASFLTGIVLGAKLAVELVWPSPPGFLSWPNDPEDRFQPWRTARLLEGREPELAELMAFSDPAGCSDKLWCVTGPRGVGKTHLGVAWLRALKRKGWHVGCLSGPVQPDWKPKRPTAVWIDLDREGEAVWESIHQLTDNVGGPPVRVVVETSNDRWRPRDATARSRAEGLMRKAPLTRPAMEASESRIVPSSNERPHEPARVSAKPIAGDPAGVGDLSKMVENATSSGGETAWTLRLQPLAKEPFRRLAEAASHQCGLPADPRLLDHLVESSEGYPQALMANIDAASRYISSGGDGDPDWSRLRLDRGAALAVRWQVEAASRELGSAGPALLALSVICGPVGSDIRQKVVPGPIEVSRIGAVFASSAEDLSLLTPGSPLDDQAEELLVQSLTALQEADQRALLSSILSAAPEKAAARLERMIKPRSALGSPGSAYRAAETNAALAGLARELADGAHPGVGRPGPVTDARDLILSEIRGMTEPTDMAPELVEPARCRARQHCYAALARHGAGLPWRGWGLDIALEGLIPPLAAVGGREHHAAGLHMLAKLLHGSRIEEDLQVLADSAVWAGDRAATVALLDRLFGSRFAESAGAWSDPPDWLADYKPRPGLAADGVPSGHPRQRALAMVDLVADPNGPLDEQQLDAAIKSEDPVERSMGCWAFYSLVGAFDLGRRVPRLSPWFVRMLANEAAKPDLEDIAWARLVLGLAKVVRPRVSDDLMMAWAETFDSRTHLSLPSLSPRTPLTDVAPALAEASRRLNAAGTSLRARVAAGALSLAYRRQEESATAVLAEAALSAQSAEDREYYLSLIATASADWAAKSLSGLFRHAPSHWRYLPMIGAFLFGRGDLVLPADDDPELALYQQALKSQTQPDAEFRTWFGPRLSLSRSGHLIHRIRAKDTTGRWACYFVYVPAERETAFLGAIDGDGTIDLEDYGFVVASSYGAEPTPEVAEFLYKEFGFEI